MGPFAPSHQPGLATARSVFFPAAGSSRREREERGERGDGLSQRGTGCPWRLQMFESPKPQQFWGK